MGPKGTGKQLGEPNHRKLARAMTAGRGGFGNIPAGYTYVGQFIDHDLTFDRSTVALGKNIPLAKLIQDRSPSLDLDSLYGAGPGDPESAKFYSDGVHLKMGKTDGARRRRRSRPATGSTSRASAAAARRPRSARR